MARINFLLLLSPPNLASSQSPFYPKPTTTSSSPLKSRYTPIRIMFATRTALTASIRQSSRHATPLACSARFYSAESSPSSTTSTPLTTSPSSKSSTNSSGAAKSANFKAASAKSYGTSANKAAVIGKLPEAITYKPKTIAHSDPAANEKQPAIETIDWSQSYHGISARPVTQAQFDTLLRPLTVQEIEVKPDGIIYLPEIRYRRRLNEAFGPMGWGMIPRGEAVVGDSIVTREYALIANGRFVSQAQGENNYFGSDQLPSAVEGCKSNALMRCCKDLGIASELWDPSFIRWFKEKHMESVWVEHMTTKKKRTIWFRKGEVDVTYPYKLSK